MGYTLPGGSGDGGQQLARLEQQDRNLAEVEVDEVLRLVGHVRAEVAADDAVPGRGVLFVELLLDVGRDVLLDVELLQGLSRSLWRPAACPPTCPHS